MKSLSTSLYSTIINDYFKDGVIKKPKDNLKEEYKEFKYDPVLSIYKGLHETISTNLVVTTKRNQSNHTKYIKLTKMDIDDPFERAEQIRGDKMQSKMNILNGIFAEDSNQLEYLRELQGLGRKMIGNHETTEFITTSYSSYAHAKGKLQPIKNSKTLSNQI